MDRTPSIARSPVARSDPAGILARDPVFWIALGLLAVAMVPLVLPVLSPAASDQWRWYYADVIYGIATALVVAWGIRRLGDATERRFWRMIASAYSVILAIELLSLLVPADQRELPIGLAVESLYLVFYVLLFLSVSAAREARSWDSGWRLDRLRTVGLGVVGFAMVLYFQGVPSAAATSVDPVVWSLDLFLFSVLDIALCLSFLGARRRHRGERWRRTFGGLALVAFAHAVMDLAEALYYLDIGNVLADMPEVVWFLPGLLLTVVARLHLGDPEASEPPTVEATALNPDRGSLVLGLISLPLLHSLLYYLDLLDPNLRELREGVVLGFIVIMGLFTLGYLRTVERARERGDRELLLSEERYRSFAHARSDALFRTEADPPIALDPPVEDLVAAASTRLRVVEAGGTSRPLRDASPQAAIGQSMGELLGLEPDDLRDALERWVAHGFELDDVEVVHGEGSDRRYYRCALHGVVTGGVLVRAWVSMSDVTAQREAVREGERLARALEQSRRLESLGTLAGGIAHDFNNLLLPIMGFTELAMSELPPTSQGRENLSQVLKASRRGADLVQQMLAVSRDQPHREVPVAVREVVEEALALLRPGLTAKVNLETDFDEPCPPILGDPSRIHQVVVNLCTNAAQAIGSGHGTVSVAVRHEVDGGEPDAPGWVAIRVRDDGPGMDEETAGRVFDPFFTTKRPGEASGLGLATVRGIVVSHKGSVSVETWPGRGSEFVVRIPATTGRSAEETPDTIDLPPALRIIVVDDEPAIVDMACHMLTSQGQVVRGFTDPAVALAALREAPDEVDLLLTDQTMPVLTGRALAAAARAVRPGLGIIIMSGYHLRSEDFEEDYVYLDKPFEAKRLMDTVRAAGLAAPPEPAPMGRRTP